MLFLALLTLLTQVMPTHTQALDANGVSLQDRLESIERMILTPGELESIVNPCSLLFDGNPSSGEQTSAEWVRIVFHDFVTADVEAGTGGLDGSISFESDRAENIGIHFVNNTIQAFTQFFDVFTSISDLIGLGLADSFTSCDPNPRFINLRIGRVDATGPGPSGVPGPADSLEVATAAFAKAGFSQTDMIQAVACGHSLGSVHQVNFPDIVPESVINDNNLDGASHFDSTPAVFDNTGVLEYLSGTGLAGGPLVVGTNTTTNSDLRIFESDGNVTVQALATSFEDSCFAIFERMLDTVPRGVVLSNPVVPREWILKEGHLDLDSEGEVVYSGTITTWTTGTAPATASYFYQSASGESGSTLASQTGGAATPRRGFGSVTDYTFSDALTDPTITSVNINGYISAINQNVFILPSESFLDSASGNAQFIVRAAVLTTLAPTGTELTATQYYATLQAGSVAQTITTVSTTMTLQRTSGVYSIYEGILEPVPIVGLNRAAKPGHFDVKVGSSQTSAKIAGGFFGTCTENVLTGC